MKSGTVGPKRNVLKMGILVAAVMSGSTWAATDEVPPIEPVVVPEVDSGDQGDPLEVGPESDNCAKTFSSGTGDSRLSWCFSNDGNIVKMEHPLGIENVRIGSFIEGFCLSSNGIKRAESFGTLSSFGLNPPVISLGTNKVKHTTIDGSWRIEQTFSQQPALKQITVVMKLFNLSGVNQILISLSRAVDADMANSVAGDLFVSRRRSVLAIQPGNNSLKLSTTGSEVYTMIYPTATPVSNKACYDLASDVVDSTPLSDRSMGLLVRVPGVPAGGNATVTFTYQLGI